jgi:hypothetical protein
MRSWRCSQEVDAFWLSTTSWMAERYCWSSAESSPVGAPSSAKLSAGSSVTEEI